MRIEEDLKLGFKDVLFVSIHQDGVDGISSAGMG